MELVAMTYNIALGRYAPDLDALAGIVAEADVVGLQEVGHDWFEGVPGHQAQALSRASGLSHFRFAATQTLRDGPEGRRPVRAPTAEERPGFGVALLSRYPLGPWTRHRLPKRQDEPRCLLSATVVGPAGPVTVLVTHLSPYEPDRRLQSEGVAQHAQTRPSPIVLLGDLNAAPGDASLAGLDRLLHATAGPEPAPSFPADDPTRSVDHVYVSADASVVGHAEPVPMPGSDHLPVMTRLSFRGGG